MAKGLGKRGHDVTLDLAPHRYQYAPWLSGLEPPAGGIDVVIANSWNAAAFAKYGPLVTVFHNVSHHQAYEPHKSPAQRLFHRRFVLPMERMAIRRSKAVIAVSRTTAMDILAFVDKDANVQTVVNGIDTEFFCPGPPKAPREPDAPIELLFVGKPSLRKGFDVVANVMKRLGPAARLTCAGDLPETGLPRLPANYLGHVGSERLREAYRAADLLLFPSRLEGFGYAAAEAMACGMPVICAKGTAVEEIVSPPLGGIAFELDDNDAMADAIAELLSDPARLAALRVSARGQTEAHLGEDRWLSQMIRVLENVYRQGRRPGGAARRARTHR